MELEMVVDLDERGSFRAHVEDEEGKNIFEFSNEDEETGWPCEDGLWLITYGYMRHCRDADGLLVYLQEIGLAERTSKISIQD